MDRLDFLNEVIDSIKNMKLTGGVHTTFDMAMMETCKAQIIEKLNEEYYGRDNTDEYTNAQLQLRFE